MDQITAAKLLENNSLNEMFIGYLNNEPSAAIVLQEEDRLFWPEENNGDALYIHKLAVRRTRAKTGLFQEMIEWAKSQTKSRDKKYLRLDCAADRPKLCALYESQGFRKVRKQFMFGQYPTAFYEWVIE